MNLLALPTGWRDEAHRLRDRYARPDLAALCEAHAAELEEALHAAEEELLPPAKAAKESLSKRRLRELEAEGKLENHGRKGAPLDRRGDLPMRAKGRGDASGFDPHKHVAEIVR